MWEWRVKRTACWPCEWKIYYTHPGTLESNDSSYYFRSREAAEKEARKRNELKSKEK